MKISFIAVQTPMPHALRHITKDENLQLKCHVIYNVSELVCSKGGVCRSTEGAVQSFLDLVKENRRGERDGGGKEASSVETGGEVTDL